MSDEGGSDLDVFEGLGKKAGGAAAPAPRQQKTLLGLASPVVPGSRGAAPPPPPPSVSKGPPPPPPPSVVSKAAPPPPPSVAVAPPALPVGPPKLTTAGIAPPAPPVAVAPAVAVAPPVAAAPPPVSRASAPPPPTSPSRIPPPPPGSVGAIVVPPPPAAPSVAAQPPQSSSPLAKPGVGRDMDWEDEDEKTTVFDRSDEDSAKALLHGLAGAAKAKAKAPSPVAPPAPAPAPSVAARPPAPLPPPPSVAAPTPPPTPPLSSVPVAPPAAAQLQRPVSVPPPPPAAPQARASVPQPSAPAYSAPQQAPQQSAPAYSAPQQYSQPQQSAPQYSQPQYSQPQHSQPQSWAPPAPKSGLNKGVIIGGVLLVAAAAAAYFAFGTPKVGTLVVTVAGPGGKAISGVSIKINDEQKCTSSPCIVEGLAAGKSHVVLVSAPGYGEAAGKAVKVIGGEETPINVELSAASAGTGIKVASKIQGLRLSVDGKDYGPLPQELTDLKPGSHNVEVGGNPMFSTFTKKVEVPADEIVVIDPTLQFIKGEITVELGDNSKGASIWLKGDGEDKALHRLKLPKTIAIPADKQMTLVAERKGFETYERTISLTPEEPSKTFTIDLLKPGAAEKPAASSTPRPTGTTTATPPTGGTTAATPSGAAHLNINAIPISNIILDGKPLGSTPKMGVSVSPGAHTVVFVNAAHGRKTQSVTVAAGGTATVVVRFP